VWLGSWYLMYLEITRWHHVKPSLAFNPDPVPGTGVRPRPGQPLILLYIACVAAPLVVVVEHGMRDTCRRLDEWIEALPDEEP
jgi:hypothetical protein